MATCSRENLTLVELASLVPGTSDNQAPHRAPHQHSPRSDGLGTEPFYYVVERNSTLVELHQLARLHAALAAPARIPGSGKQGVS